MLCFLVMDRPIHNETPFSPQEAGRDPFALFDQWFAAEVKADPNNAGVMTLATAMDNRPSARMVLLKEHGADGFVFYTHTLSRKGRELDANPQAALTFWWPSFAKASADKPPAPERQVRIEGMVEKISAKASDAYFATRDRNSQFGAWASAQSSVIKTPVTLDEARAKFKEEKIPRPCSWGGLRLIPKRFEFWQGRASRLHDRICFEQKQSEWKVTRLAP